MDYLPGLLVLEHSLRQVESRYKLVALYTDALPEQGHRALDERAIAKERVEYLIPSAQRDYTRDPRFYDTWTKLAVFNLVQYERVVLVDADMLVVKNIDDLMDLELDGDEEAGLGKRVYAASHACFCNPLKKPRYPEHWIRENCPYMSQHLDVPSAQTSGAPVAEHSMPNGGLIVLNPSAAVFAHIARALTDEDRTLRYEFPDQALLGDVFAGRWVPLPYVYNALKFLQWRGVHDTIWRDEELKNIHYCLVPKPWDVDGGSEDGLVRRWQVANEERLRCEKERGIL